MTPRFLKRFFRDQLYWDDITFFRNVSIFHGFRTRDLALMIQSMQRRAYQAGEVLFREGETGKAVFIVRSGKVELTRKMSGGEEKALAQLGPGHIFGEMALLENMPRLANAVMIEDGEICLLYTSTFDSLIKKNPNLGVTLLRNMAIILSSLVRRSVQSA